MSESQLFPDNPSTRETMTTGPLALYDMLGGFWRNQLGDADLLAIEAWAQLVIAEDVVARNADCEAAISIHDIKPFFRKQWEYVELLESGLTVEPNVITFGSGRRFDGSFVYGQTDSSSFAWPLSSQLRSVGVVFDTPVDPKHIWDVTNFAFDPETSVIRFASNPFDTAASELVYNSDGSAKTYVAADGTTQQDRRIKLWLRGVELDESTPYLRFGSVIGIPGKSSQAYIDTVEATWSMLLQGPSVDALKRGLVASAGLSYVEGEETVEVVDTDIDGAVVVTSSAVYRAHAGATPLVRVGDILHPGDFVFDTVTLTDFSDGNRDDIAAIKGLVLTPALAAITGTVVVPNKTGSWEVLGIRDGEPEVRFEVLGSDTDVAEFWNAVHSRGVASGKPLADYVDAAAPVNPLQFILDNIIGAGLIFIEVRPQHFLSAETGFLGRIKTLLPAGVLVVVQIALEPASDSLSFAAADDAVTAFPAVSASPDSIATTDHEPKVWQA